MDSLEAASIGGGENRCEEGSYGPVRRKQEEVRERESGIIFRPAEVEEAVTMDADDASDEETAGPYEKPKFEPLVLSDKERKMERFSWGPDMALGDCMSNELE